MNTERHLKQPDSTKLKFSRVFTILNRVTFLPADCSSRILAVASSSILIIHLVRRGPSFVRRMDLISQGVLGEMMSTGIREDIIESDNDVMRADVNWIHINYRLTGLPFFIDWIHRVRKISFKQRPIFSANTVDRICVAPLKRLHIHKKGKLSAFKSQCFLQELK